MTIRLVYLDYWRGGTILAESSQHPEFPSEESQADPILQPFRTRYGTDSGNGLFVIDANNKYIDFDESAGELNATLTEGNYNGNSLAAEIKTRLDAAGGIVYVVAYSESTGKFTISSVSNFALLWKTGTKGSDNADTHVGTTIGFDDSADDDGATNSFTSDYKRIHWPNAFIDLDLGAAYAIDYLAILGHNFSSNAVIKFYGADDSSFSVNVITETITYNATNIRKFPSSAQTKRYWRFYVEDPTNTNAYLSVGVIIVGIYWQPNRHFVTPYSRGRMDPSDRYRSDGQSLYASERTILKTGSLPFAGITDTNKDNILTMFDTVGLTKGIDIIFDPSSPNSDSIWAVHRNLNDPEYKHPDYWTWDFDYIELK